MRVLWQEGSVHTAVVFLFQLYFYIIYIKSRIFTLLQTLHSVLFIRPLINLNKMVSSFDLENKNSMQNNNKNNIC